MTAESPWLIDQAWTGLIREAGRQFEKQVERRGLKANPELDFDRLGLLKSRSVTPFEVFSPEYLAAYRGSRSAVVLPKDAAGIVASRLPDRGVRISALASSRNAVLSSWDPFAFRDTPETQAAKPLNWFSLQWTQAIVLDVSATMQLLNRVGMRTFRLRVVDEAGGPVADAKVTLLFVRRKSTGVEQRTADDGWVELAVPVGMNTIDAIAVVPRHSHWSFAELRWTVPSGPAAITLKALARGGHRFKYLAPPDPAAGTGVRCAVIDAGIGPHPALSVFGGASLVAPEDEADEDLGSHLDNGVGHGTHVAGIIAARDLGNGEPVGLAPAVELHSLRVSPKLTREAPAYAVAAAIEMAVARDCHLINLSLGYPERDPDVEVEVEKAFEAGCVVIAAVGNDPNSGIMCPASSPHAIGVAALGHQAHIPAGTMSALAFTQPPNGADPDDFVASFNSRGVEVKVSAPGVGVISCAPGGAFYAAEDGTSMATPVVTGYAARVLATRPEVLNMRGRARAEAIRDLVLQACDRLGFAASDVGHGHPRP